MTEPTPADLYQTRNPTEGQVQRPIVKLFRDNGLHVIVLSQDRAARKQLKGVSDLIVIGHDRVLFAECKRPLGGERSAVQVEFADDITPHLGEHVQYTVFWQPAQAEPWLAWFEGRRI